MLLKFLLYAATRVPQALTEYRAELRDDPIINTHLAKLYDNLLEQNLIRVIEPFSRVQVSTALVGRSSCSLHVIQRVNVRTFFMSCNPTFLQVISDLLLNASYNLSVIKSHSANTEPSPP